MTSADKIRGMILRLDLMQAVANMRNDADASSGIQFAKLLLYKDLVAELEKQVKERRAVECLPKEKII